MASPIVSQRLFVIFCRHHFFHRLVGFLGLLGQQLVFGFQKFRLRLEFPDSNPRVGQLADEVVDPTVQHVLRVGQAATEILDFVLQQVVFSLEEMTSDHVVVSNSK